jgi:hypothetical protein
MQFSDTTNRQGLIQDCEWWLDLGKGGIANNSDRLDDFTRSINQWYDKVQVMILQAHDEWDYDDSNHTDFPILKGDLVKDQQDYALPSSTLKIKRVETKMDGSNYQKAQPIDINEISEDTSTSTIDDEFNESEPFYDMRARSIFLYPIPDENVTDGIKIWIQRKVNLFSASDTTKTPGFDRQFHRMLSIGASYDWAAKKGLGVKNDLLTLLQDYRTQLKDYYGKKQRDRDITLKANPVDYS